MKTGRMPENVWKRSIRKNIKHEFLDTKGAGIGSTSASFKACGEFYVSEPCMVPMCEQMGAMAVYLSSNAVAAKGKASGVMLELMLDGRSPEEFASHVAKDAGKAAEALGMEIAGFNVHILPGLKKSYILATAVAKADEDVILADKAGADQDIIVTKWVGMSGTSMLAAERKAELIKRYPSEYIEAAVNLKKYLSVRDEMEVLSKQDNISYISAVSETGIFGHLWDMSEKSGVGMKLNLRSFPFRQETIEVCNHLDVDPYILSSSGAMLIVASDGEKIVEKLEGFEIPATIIGKTSSKNDKIIENGDEIRFLTKPCSDEIYRILG